MKEKGPQPSNMISRNWVLKRKRKKLPCGPGVSASKDKEEGLAAESTAVNCSKKDLQNSETNFDCLTSKKKGNDGVIDIYSDVIDVQNGFSLVFCY